MLVIPSGPAALPAFNFEASSGTLKLYILEEEEEEDWIKHQITLTNCPNYLQIQKWALNWTV